MDCPSEERLIRMKLDEIKSIQKLDFDIPNRNLAVYYSGDVVLIDQSLQELDLNSILMQTEEADLSLDTLQSDHTLEKQLLWAVLIINFGFFVVEIITGLISNSMGLVADSLDMLADAFVYALSLYAVGHTVSRKKRIAAISGYFQAALAIFGLVEVIRRFFGTEEVPVFQSMIMVSAFALIGNAVSLYLLQKSKSQEAHMQASIIFTSNDVLANLGVIVAGVAVYFTHSKLPDLLIGAAVFLMVIRGAIRILKLSK